jgi:heat shock protein HslJ
MDPLPRADPVVLETPVPATRKGLEHRVWFIEEAVEDGERRDLYAPILLHFAKGRIGVEAGCNGLSGTYALKGGRLEVAELGTTLAACEDERMAQDEWVARVLGGRPRVALDGEKIELATDTAALRGRDREVAEPDFPLAGRAYRIVAFVGGETGTRTEAAWLQQTELRFATDGTFTVRAPCGTFSGEYGIEADRVSMDFAPDGPCFTGDREVANILAALWTNPPQPHWIEGDERGVRLQQDMDGSVFELVAID